MNQVDRQADQCIPEPPGLFGAKPRTRRRRRLRSAWRRSSSGSRRSHGDNNDCHWDFLVDIFRSWKCRFWTYMGWFWKIQVNGWIILKWILEFWSGNLAGHVDFVYPLAGWGTQSPRWVLNMLYVEQPKTGPVQNVTHLPGEYDRHFIDSQDAVEVGWMCANSCLFGWKSQNWLSVIFSCVFFIFVQILWAAGCYLHKDVLHRDSSGEDKDETAVIILPACFVSLALICR